jgi:hypothetical protein
MLQSPSSDQPLQDAERFILALRAEAKLARVARVESIVFAGDAETALALEPLLADLWPVGAAAAPRHEVVWARMPRAVAGIDLTAFDVDGRVLLRQSHQSRALKQKA